MTGNEVKGAFEMWHGLIGKAAHKAVPHLVAFAAYEALHRAVAKAPWREATVTAMACGIRGVRKAEVSTERARLTAADMFAEAIERSGEEVSPSEVAEEKVRPRRRRTAEARTTDADH
jgi:Zn-dependent M32 family carboxypeptidase